MCVYAVYTALPSATLTAASRVSVPFLGPSPGHRHAYIYPLGLESARPLTARYTHTRSAIHILSITIHIIYIITLPCHVYIVVYMIAP